MAQSVGILGKVTGSLVQVKTYRLMYNWAFEVKVTGRAFFFFLTVFVTDLLRGRLRKQL